MSKIEKRPSSPSKSMKERRLKRRRDQEQLNVDLEDLINKTINYIQKTEDPQELVSIDLISNEDATDFRIKKMAQVAVEHVLRERMIQRLADEFLTTFREETQTT